MKLGLLVSCSGPTGLWAIGCRAAAAVAVADLNAAGGVLGQEVTLHLADAGANPSEAAAGAGLLADRHGVDAVIGVQPSHMRAAVRRRLGGAVPYLYTPQYEGGFPGPATLALGATDADVLDPALAWFAERRGVGRAFFVGNDYVWPRTAHGVALAAMAAAGVRPVGSAILPFGTGDYGPLLAEIRRAAPDLVITVLLGEESVRFHRAFAAAGLGAGTLRLALATDETILLAIGPEAAENLHAAESFFADAPERRQARMTELYDLAYGSSRPPLNVFSAGCYRAVRLAALLARRASRPEGRPDRALPLRAALCRAIGGGGTRPGATGQRPRRRLPLSLAEADGTRFRVIGTL